jgi:hypothetical protein
MNTTESVLAVMAYVFLSEHLFPDAGLAEKVGVAFVVFLTAGFVVAFGRAMAEDLWPEEDDER